MDNQLNAKLILESYSEIREVNILKPDTLIFHLLEKEFLLFLIPNDSVGLCPFFLINVNEEIDCPHILLKSVDFSSITEIQDKKYRPICLYEEDMNVYSILSYEDRLRNSIERLIELLSLNNIKKEIEYQKEFMFYWNSASSSKITYEIYLNGTSHPSRMNLYFNRAIARIVANDVILSDLKARNKSENLWTPHIENDVYFIPICDTRDILPPRNGYSWSSTDIRNVFFAKQIDHITSETFSFIETTIPKTQNIILVFNMQSPDFDVTFSLKIKCKYIANRSLLNKILNDIVSVEPLYSTRKDYLYLNKLIGNDIHLSNKKILLVGAGSLGSYVASELVKNGTRTLTIYDDDSLSSENILRWAYGQAEFSSIGLNKALLLAYHLNNLHPEIQAKGVNKNLNKDSLLKEMSLSDMILFTIGSSDAQLHFNRILKENNCKVPVIFTWLEAGGKYSHILVVDYKNIGCFECLYTDRNGCPTNNRATKSTNFSLEKNTVRNGCGGTRVAYGTATLLRTTSVLLEIIRKTFENSLSNNTLIDIFQDHTQISDIEFPLEACNCCGDKKRK